MRRTWTLRACLIALAYGELGFLVIPRLHLRSVETQPVMMIAVIAWSLYAVVLAYLMPRILLETRMRFREIAAITTVGAVVSLGTTAALLQVAAPGYAILGGLLGEIVAALATWRAAAQPLNGRRAAAPLRFPHGGLPADAPLRPTR